MACGAWTIRPGPHKVALMCLNYTPTGRRWDLNNSRTKSLRLMLWVKWDDAVPWERQNDGRERQSSQSHSKVIVGDVNGMQEK